MLDNIMQQKVAFFLLKNLTKSDRAGMAWPLAHGLALCLQLLGGNGCLGIRYTRLWQWRTQNFSIAGDINKKQQDLGGSSVRRGWTLGTCPRVRRKTKKEKIRKREQKIN